VDFHVEGGTQDELVGEQVLRKICGPKRDEVAEGSGEDCITKRFMVCTLLTKYYSGD
jgi:hypothetical protein